MTLPIIATMIRLIWGLIEYPYLFRYRVQPTKDWDRHSARLWDVANLIEPVGMILGLSGIGRIHTRTNLIGSLGLMFLVAGIAVRWSAVYALGKYFTGTVLIKNDHRLIRTGLYKHLRHPAYAGSLLVLRDAQSHLTTAPASCTVLLPSTAEKVYHALQTREGRTL